MRIARPLLLCAALAASLPALAAITYPVDVPGTAGQWAIWDTQASAGHPTGQVFRRNIAWPVADGGPVPGLDPRYVFLRMTRVEPPVIDSRLQEIAYPCPEVADIQANTLLTTCTASVRPPADLITAVENAAQARIEAAVGALGIRNPADLLRGVALLEAARRGTVLTEPQSAWLQALGAAGVEYVDQVRAAQAVIAAWIASHPGEIPDLGESVWPPLPVVAP